MSQNFLVLYDLCPESIRLYSMTTHDPELAAKVRACHQRFVNQEEEMPPEIEAYITKEEGHFGTLLYDSSKDKGPAPIQLITGGQNVEFIHTGFLL